MKTLELPVGHEESDLDSMPELEDVPNLDSIEIPLWLIPNGVMVTFRGGRVFFEREQGPPLAGSLGSDDRGARLNIRR